MFVRSLARASTLFRASLGVTLALLAATAQAAPVFTGRPFQASGGDTSSPSQLYFFGIFPPSWNALLVTVMLLGAVMAGSFADSDCAPPHPATPRQVTNNGSNRSRTPSESHDR